MYACIAKSKQKAIYVRIHFAAHIQIFGSTEKSKPPEMWGKCACVCEKSSWKLNVFFSVCVCREEKKKTTKNHMCIKIHSNTCIHS